MGKSQKHLELPQKPRKPHQFYLHLVKHELFDVDRCKIYYIVVVGTICEFLRRGESTSLTTQTYSYICTTESVVDRRFGEQDVRDTNHDAASRCVVC